ncbi:MAG: complex I subunit 5 family protein [Chloroflexota bacterium]
MATTPFLWMIILPIGAAPLIYLVGRFEARRAAPRARSAAAWLALLALLLTWIPFGLTARQFAAYGAQSLAVEAIPLRFDGLSLLLTIVALGLGTLVTLFSCPAMCRKPGEEKYYAMLVTMVGVMIALGMAGDLFNLWVWFETMAVSSYLLVVFNQEEPASLEAGVKYVVQSAIGSVLVLIGIALTLLSTGTLDLQQIAAQASASPLLLAAGALFVIGFGVKAALVPMHTWLPDAHTQAPSGISAMLSGVVIEAGLVAMLRALAPLTGVGGQGFPAATWGGLLIGMGALNMIVGNLMALRQVQVKRMLAYSSLSHMGYMVFGLGVAIYAGQAAGAQGGMFHLFNHGLMKGLAFLSAGALLYVISDAAVEHDPHAGHKALTVADLNGAAQRYPVAALAFSLAVLGLGGLPPLAGFMSKWQIFVAGFSAHNTLIAGLVIFAALNSVLSLGYYAPLVNAMYRKQPSPAILNGGALPLRMGLPLAVLAVLVLLFGLWPGLAQGFTAPAGQAILAAFGG